MAVVPAFLTLAVVYAQPEPVIRTGGAVLGPRHPCSAMTFLREHGIVANVYTPLWWGSYLTWHLYPRVHVSMDGRNVTLYPDEMVEQNLKFYSSDPAVANLDDPLEHDTDVLVVPADRPILTRLTEDARWLVIHSDGDASVFARSDRVNQLAASSPRVAPERLVCPPVLQ
jgi:hypothetical protein